MNNLSERLKEERIRLGFSQEAFGKIAGVKKLAQFNYEKGERSPDAAYLGAIAAAGADVSYIITGERAGGLATDERILLRQYRSMSDDEREILLGMAIAKSSLKKEGQGQINLTQSNIGNGVVIQQLGKDK